MKLFSFLFLCPFLVIALSCQHSPKVVVRDIASLKKSDEVEGIWFLQGTSSLRGPYNGEIELRKSFDGTYNVIRMVTYINYFYDGLKVQEVWTGKAVANNDSILISYDLRQGDYIKKIGSEKRSVAEVGKTINVVSDLRANDQKIIATEFSDIKDSKYQEWISTRRELEPNPLWTYKIELLDLKGSNINESDKKALYGQQKNIAKNKNINSDTLKNLESSDVKLLRDYSDFNFYKNNLDTIRVVNKVIDNISISESVSKRNAYAITVDQKSQSYEKNTKENHTNSFGLIVASDVFSNGHLKSNRPTKDSIFLTSIYTTTLSVKNSMTGSDQDLEDLKRYTRNLLSVAQLSISRNKSIGAIHSALGIIDFEPYKNWEKTTWGDKEILLLEDKTKESHLAMINAFLWSYSSLPEKETNLKKDIRETMRHLLSQFSDYGYLSYVKAIFDYPNLNETDLQQKKTEALTQIGVTVKYPNSQIYYLNGQSNWEENFREYLALDSFRVSCRISRDDKCTELAEQQAVKLQNTLKYVHLPYVEFLSSEKSYTRMEKKDNDSIVTFLSDMPYPRANSEMTIDQSIKQNWVVSLIDQNFQRSPNAVVGENKNSKNAAIIYPIYELGAYSSSFLLKESPFKSQAVTSKGYENPAVDYLYVYWMSRYMGLEK